MVNTAQAAPGRRLIVKLGAAEMAAVDELRRLDGISREAAVATLVREALRLRGLREPSTATLPVSFKGDVGLPAICHGLDVFPKRYSDSGIRLETVRGYIEAEIRRSPALVEAPFHAAELPEPVEVVAFRSNSLKGKELTVDALAASDQRLRLVIGCTIVDRYYWQRTFHGGNPMGARRGDLKVGSVMLAPRALFELTWQEIPEEWTFEYVRQFASPTLKGVLEEAVTRANTTFHRARTGDMNYRILMARLHGGL